MFKLKQSCLIQLFLSLNRVYIYSFILIQADNMHCRKCSYTSKYLSNIIQHIEEKHMTVEKVLQQSNNIQSLVLYKCALCNEEFDRKSDFKSHNLLCKSGLPTAASVECQVCNKLFRSKVLNVLLIFFSQYYHLLHSFECFLHLAFFYFRNL